MPPKIKVEIAQMDLIGQVFDRQKGHMQGVGTFVQTNCRASGAFTGVLGLLEGHYRGAYDAGSKGMTNGATIAEVCSDKTAQTRKTFIDKDRAAYERIAAKNGVKVPYEAPRGGTLPPGAPMGGGSGPGSGFGPFKFMKDFKDWVDIGGKVGKPLYQDPKGIWKVKNGDYDKSEVTDPKYWIQRGLTKQVNALRQKMDGMSPSERADYLRQRQRDAHESGQDAAREHVPGREDDRGSRSPAAGSVTAKDATRIDTASKVAQLPGAVVGETEGVIAAGEHLGESIDQTGRVNDAVNGPKNDESINWADKNKGGTW
jgi:hypothetical protein